MTVQDSEEENNGWEYLGNRWAHSAEYRCVHCGHVRVTTERQPDPTPDPHGCDVDG